jgi:hypothetical protein
MRSAFRRGVDLLSETETDSIRSQGQTIEIHSKSTLEHMEGIGGVPENVTQLKPVINKLMSKVITIAI